MSASSGRDGTYAGHDDDTGTCNNCHFGGDPAGGGISLTGAPISYDAGATYPLTLTLTSDNANFGGFQIVAATPSSNLQLGTFSTTPGETKLLTGMGADAGRLVQSSAKAFSGNSVSWSFNWTAPVSGTSVQFYFAGNTTDGSGGTTSGDIGFNGSSALIPLPVELSFFEVKPMKNEIVKLNWQTQSEENSDYFEIQRSRSENENEFENIGRVSSEGNSTWVNDYEFEDRLPVLNQFSYYRLKQVDLDGKFVFSNIQSVKIKGEGVLGVFPNPIKNNQTLNISYPNKSDLEKRVHIVNSMGAIVFKSVLENQNGENNAIFDLPELAVGIYFVSVFENKNLIEVKKLLVQ